MIKVVSKLRENECPICNSKLICLEQEASVFNVNDNGTLDPYYNSFDSFYKCILYCRKCKNEYDAIIKNNMVHRVLKSDNTLYQIQNNPFYGGYTNDAK